MIDELVKVGVNLDRFCERKVGSLRLPRPCRPPRALHAHSPPLAGADVHKFCSPTRCAIQTGRAPVHVNVINADPSVHNPADPVGGYAGIPRNMTGAPH